MNEYSALINKNKYIIKEIDESKVIINDNVIEFNVNNFGDDNYIIKFKNEFFRILFINRNNDKFTFLLNGKTFEVEIRTGWQQKALEIIEAKKKSLNKIDVKAPMSGLIVKIKKNKGDIIKLNDTVMILEAMKMENELKSPADGMLKDIFVKENFAVEKGEILFSIG